MDNKVLVSLIIPQIDYQSDVYLPINKRIGNIILLIVKSMNEVSNKDSQIDKNCALYNRDTLEKYSSNDLVYNTTIRNGTTLILM